MDLRRFTCLIVFLFLSGCRNRAISAIKAHANVAPLDPDCVFSTPVQPPEILTPGVARIVVELQCAPENKEKILVSALIATDRLPLKRSPKLVWVEYRRTSRGDLETVLLVQ